MNFTLLTEDQIWGNDSLEVMKIYGTKVSPTDLTLILGGTSDGTSKEKETCPSWSASLGAHGCACCVHYDGEYAWNFTRGRQLSTRPALPPSESSKINPREVGTIKGIRIVEYGEYPQTVANGPTCEKLERLYETRSLHPTGKNYTFDSVNLTDFNTPFKATSYQEYKLDSKKYIRILGRTMDNDNKLSNGEYVDNGRPYWVEVKPIKWLMDKNGTMVAEEALFAGIQFDTKDIYDGNFSKTSIKHYLDTYFAKEIEPAERVTSRENTKPLDITLQMQKCYKNR